MTGQITTLSNGLRIVTHEMAYLQTTSLGVWVAAGARHERKHENGVSHLLEHMAFKGTRKRTARAIAEEIEALGGELNAATGHETTAYFARVLSGDEERAVAILADILQDPNFAKDELAREREVIMQEIAATQDSPDDIAYDLLHDAAFPDQALGRSILGTPESVQRFSPADLRAFLQSQYQAENMVVAAAGGVRHDQFVRHVEALFGAPSKGSRRDEAPARYTGGVRVSRKAFEQGHFLMGFAGPSYRAPEYFAAQVFSGIFGGGMSSRLFQEVREKRGLCYSIYSGAWSLRDCGMCYVHAASAPETMKELVAVIGTELAKIRSEAPSETELRRVKAQLKVGLLMALESSSARAEQMARHLICHGRLISSDELMTRVDNVTASDVLEFAQSMASRPPSIAIVGAGKQSNAMAAWAEGQMTN